MPDADEHEGQGGIERVGPEFDGKGAGIETGIEWDRGGAVNGGTTIKRHGRIGAAK